MTPTLQTQRLVLSPYVPADEEDFVALFQDPLVAQWIGDGLATETEDREMFGRIFTNVYAQNRFDIWAVREDGRYVGHAEIKPAKVVEGFELVYALSKAAWGRGLGTELAQAIVDYGFTELGLTEVHATVAPQNTASIALLKRIGFEHIRDIEEEDGSTTVLLTTVKAGTAELRPSPSAGRAPSAAE